uniref:Putative group i salivary lipocalin n=1 Tax=Rhipicephalus pulchellus TaxID=72859 RepID=L7LTT8_RHIPC
MKSNMSSVTKEVIAAFLLCAVNILLKCDYFSTLANAEVLDVTKFYVENAEIWIVNTTMPTFNFCEVDFVRKTSMKYAFFNRTYFWNHTTRDLLGQFKKNSTSNVFDTMMVAPYHGTSFESMDQLVYSDESYTCGIFNVTMFTHWRKSYFDIRVKQPVIRSPSPSCVEKFVQLSTGQRVRTLYNDSCQNNRRW